MPRLVLEVADTKVELPARADESDASAEDSDAVSAANLSNISDGASAETQKGLKLGKHQDNDLVIASAQTSRHHAVIEFKHNDFFLVDASTNGTYVQTEDEQVTLVHRSRLRLWGTGWICLGEPLTVGDPIHFRQVDRGSG